jgi:hypothetical protein
MNSEDDNVTNPEQIRRRKYLRRFAPYFVTMSQSLKVGDELTIKKKGEVVHLVTVVDIEDCLDSVGAKIVRFMPVT